MSYSITLKSSDDTVHRIEVSRKEIVDVLTQIYRNGSEIILMEKNFPEITNLSELIDHGLIKLSELLPPDQVTSARRLIAKGDLDSFLKQITDPREICHKCDGQVDCIGADECYPAEEYLSVEMKITQPTQEQIRRLVKR